MFSVLVWFVLLQHNTELVRYKVKEAYLAPDADGWKCQTAKKLASW